MGKSQGILNVPEKSGKITQNAGKFRNLRKMLFVIFSFQLKKHNIKTWGKKWEKNTRKVGEFCQSGKVGTMG